MHLSVRDLGVAARTLARQPAYATVAIVTLALGIGANAAVFSVVRGVLARPLPYADAPRTVLLTGRSEVSIPDGNDWRQRSRTLDGVALMIRQWDFDLLGRGEPARLSGSVVEPGLFRILGVRPLVGRVLAPADDRPGAPAVAVIGVGLWRRLFGADPRAVGRTVILNDHPTTIVGVVPETADLFGDGVEVWAPVATETPWALTARGTNNFDAIGHLRPGATLDGARRELATMSAALAAAYPESNTGKIAVPTPLLAALVGDVRAPLLVLEAAVLLLLALVTANLTGLLVARGSARRGELALRVALGARRHELTALFVGEGVVLAVAGGALGVALAALGEHALVAALPPTLPRVGEVQLDLTVVGAAGLMACASGAVLAIVPAIQCVRALGRPSSATTTRASRGVHHRRLLAGLVATEVALAVVVLAGSALLGRTFLALEHVRLGFDPTNVVTAELVLPAARYGAMDPQTRTIRGVVEHIAAAPGVEAAGSIIGLPLGTGSIGHRLLVQGRPPVAPGAEPSARDRPVSGEYFRALRIPLVRGRGFTAGDDERSVPVAIVNQALARQLWPDRSPLGARIRWIGTDSVACAQDAVCARRIGWMTVVGVVGDTKSDGLTSDDQPAVYTPYVQRTEAWQRWSSLVVRGSGGAGRLARVMHDAVAAVDPLIPLGPARAMTALRASAMAQQQMDAVVLGAFAAAALLIAVQGIYGTLAYAVTQRHRELGIRVAVGATPADVRRDVVWQGMRPTVIGIAVGLVAAVLAGRVARSVLFGVSPEDPLTYLAVAATIAGAAWCGALVPASRASRADPVVALREP